VAPPRPDPSSVPDAPGAYLFRDADGRVIYAGKALSLRKRLASYWGRPLHPRTEAMVASARSVEWIVASTEVDALMLEYNLIKSHRPRFNVRYRDDKSYPYLALTVGETWPRARVLRGPKRKGVRYFGPYGHAYAIRETLDALTRVFPVRTCSNSFFDQRARAGRPCLYYDIGRCAGPCVPKLTEITEERYRGMVDSLAEFLDGSYRPVLQRLDTEMREAAEALEFERAAKLRDRLAAARKAMESQEMVLDRGDDIDVVGMQEDDLEAAFQVFFVRRGRVMGRRGWVVDKVEDMDSPALVSSFLRELYMDREEVPPRILVPVWPLDRDVLQEWLGGVRGSRVHIAVPARGELRRLLQLVGQNAKEAFARHKLKRASDFGARSRALSELGEQLGLEIAPLRIECYDISNLGATDKVASMVVFEDGLPKRSDYRRFEIKGVAGQDDFASMEEVLRRRFARMRADSTPDGPAPDGPVPDGAPGPDGAATAPPEEAPPLAGGGAAANGGGRAGGRTGGRRRFAYPPSLVVVDGGRGQLSVAERVLSDYGLEIPAIGLAKRLEEVYLPGQPQPLLIPRGSEALFVLQHIRDEAHRFAITYHRKKRARRAMRSELDDIPGVGATRKKALLKRFGSVARLRTATAQELQATPGVGPNLARTVYEYLHGGQGASGGDGAVAGRRAG
jgi:excinuclease ABC subunit C